MAFGRPPREYVGIYDGSEDGPLFPGGHKKTEAIQVRGNVVFTVAQAHHGKCRVLDPVKQTGQFRLILFQYACLDISGDSQDEHIGFFIRTVSHVQRVQLAVAGNTRDRRSGVYPGSKFQSQRVSQRAHTMTERSQPAPGTRARGVLLALFARPHLQFDQSTDQAAKFGFYFFDAGKTAFHTHFSGITGEYTRGHGVEQPLKCFAAETPGAEFGQCFIGVVGATRKDFVDHTQPSGHTQQTGSQELGWFLRQFMQLTAAEHIALFRSRVG